MASQALTRRRAPATCPDCARRLKAITFAQPALFFHGGHGATTTTTIIVCGRCGYTRHRSTETTNPRHT